MHPASLPGGADQDGLDRAAQPGVGVGDDQPYSGQAGSSGNPPHRSDAAAAPVTAAGGVTGLRTYETMIPAHAISQKSGVNCAVVATSGVVPTTP
jgi:hypothetical protein